MSVIRPKYITFDCYGTLTNFQMAAMTRELFADRISAEQMPLFVKDFGSFRLDEVLGAWKPYEEVVKTALERTCKRWGITYKDEEGQLYYDAVPTWGPHADVPAGLAKVAKEIPLVIFSNACDDQIMSNVDKLGAPFYKVFTAQQAQAYKPRLAAFEYMLDNLGCGPEDVLHVSSSFRYDLFSAHDMGIKNKAFVARGHEQPANSIYEYHQIPDIGGLAGLVGLE
ncbi:dehalogenase [Pokkaliibacter plantistimulans]|uniref:Dehalogenase n=1 Tax=Pokkaliibacter plantistimulans TaxID=1635171 RepID=A0ABX5LZR0_9GAMM|nr:haloacid dehalogenase type II [Pokkaliibacter plantistimulans]PXF31145.1 dehalogenase [Pokkaliibacter plantistimulans]